MADEKDRLHDKLHQREKATEDRFIKEREDAIRERRRQEQGGAQPGAGSGLCPRCGAALTTVEHNGVNVEECPACHGMWLDQGEVETLASRERDSWLGRFFYRPRR